MKKTGLLTIVLSLLIAAFCLNCYADNTEAQVKALEQQASRIESQIEQARKATQAATDNQVKALQNSVEQFIRQRVQIDAQIARLEGQIEQVQTQSQANLDRQLAHYQKSLGQVQSQLSGMIAASKAKAAPAQAPAPAQAQKNVKPAAKPLPNAAAAKTAAAPKKK